MKALIASSRFHGSFGKQWKSCILSPGLCGYKGPFTSHHKAGFDEGCLSLIAKFDSKFNTGYKCVLPLLRLSVTVEQSLPRRAPR